MPNNNDDYRFTQTAPQMQAIFDRAQAGGYIDQTIALKASLAYVNERFNSLGLYRDADGYLCEKEG